MAAFYADENFPLAVVDALRTMGHDVLTALDAGQANQRVPDTDILEFAARSGRTLLTLNRWDFVGLHARVPAHAGIVACTQDGDHERQAVAIDRAVRDSGSLAGVLIRVNRPA